jgi:RNA polymerase sigma-70 factor, ECF subfamily
MTDQAEESPMEQVNRAVSERQCVEDDDAFHKMLIAALPRLRAYAVTLTRDRSTAEDLLQETAAKALAHRKQFQAGTNFTAWMYCILRHEFVNTLRRAKHQPALMAEIPDSLAARPGDQEEKQLAREVIAAMDQLPSQQREVLILICAGGMSYEEAAVAVQASIGTVKSRLWRARRQMQQILLGEERVADMDATAPHAEVTSTEALFS